MLPLLTPPPVSQVKLSPDGFWGRRRRTNREVTLPSQWLRLQESGHLAALRPDFAGRRHRFWDSDVAKWLEAAWTELSSGGPDSELEARARQALAGLAAAQEEDGYLQSQVRYEEPAARWANLRDGHEMYSMGHVLEACCAQAEGGWGDEGRALADRLLHHLWRTAGPEGQPFYCGHPEIELALLRYHRLTGDARAHRLAQLLIDRRGTEPHLFAAEAARRGEDHRRHWSWKFTGGFHYFQAHAPVREQSEAVGHAVRAVYLYSAMTDLWAAGDESLCDPVRRLWDNLTQRRLYLTGGLGSTREGERLTHDYDLPDNAAYCETCAAIGLARWARRRLGLELCGEVADVLELALHNAVLSGVSLDGESYFYGNPLAVHPHDQRTQEEVGARRRPWFGCACCPPNLARTLSGLAEFAAASGGDTAALHLYLAGEYRLATGFGPFVFRLSSDLPWSGSIHLTVCEAPRAEVNLALRIPAWAEGWTARLNGREPDGALRRDGYWHLRRCWTGADHLHLEFPVRPRRTWAHPAVRSAAGRVALQRGPLVYCLEEADHGPGLDDLTLPDRAEIREEPCAWLGEGVALTATGEGSRTGAGPDPLYRPRPSARETRPLRFVPYAVWGNRAPGEMRVWVRDR